MENEKTDRPFLQSMARRVTARGGAITAFVGLIMAVNAALSDQYTGAGVCLVASALAFGAVGHAFMRR